MANQAATWGHKPFTLMVPYPKKIFTEDMLNLTIEQAGLVPQGSLVATLSSELYHSS